MGVTCIPVSLRTLYMENCSLSKAFLVEFMASVGLPVLEPVLANAFAEASVDTAVTLGALVEAVVPEVSDVLVSVAANRHPLVTSTKCSKKGSVRLKFKVKSESMAIEGKLEEFPIKSLSFELKDEEKEEK